MEVYIVWANEPWEESFIDKIFSEEDKANKYIEYRDKMTGMEYTIEKKRSRKLNKSVILIESRAVLMRKISRFKKFICNNFKGHIWEFSYDTYRNGRLSERQWHCTRCGYGKVRLF